MRRYEYDGRGGRVLLAPSGGREIMRRAYKHLGLVALVSLFVSLGMTASYKESSLAQTAAPQPNIIFILTDDMRKDDLNARYMPRTTTKLVVNREVQEFIGASAAPGKPFFAYVTPYAPHGPATPAPRYRHTFDQENAPRLASFNEADVSDKPPWIQSQRMLTSTDIASIDQRHENRVESLQAVDALVAGVVGKLRAEDVLSNTYIVFTSDNGFHHGEHRIRQGKARPYEEAARVPLVIRGPDAASPDPPVVQPGSSTDKLVLNTDYFPTFMDLAGAQTPPYVDGRSLLPVLTGSATTSWRTAILIEGRKKVQTPRFPLTVTTTASVRAQVSTLSTKEASANSMILPLALIPPTS